jgi:hypothetical protein
VRTQRVVDFGRGILKRGNRPSHRASLEHVRNFSGHRLLENLALSDEVIATASRRTTRARVLALAANFFRSSVWCGIAT